MGHGMCYLYVVLSAVISFTGCATHSPNTQTPPYRPYVIPRQNPIVPKPPPPVQVPDIRPSIPQPPPVVPKQINIPAISVPTPPSLPNH